MVRLEKVTIKHRALETSSEKKFRSGFISTFLYGWCLSLSYYLLILLSKLSLNKEQKQNKANEWIPKQIKNSNPRCWWADGLLVARPCESPWAHPPTSACTVKSFSSMQPWWEDLHHTHGKEWQELHLFSGDFAAQVFAGQPLRTGQGRTEQQIMEHKQQASHGLKTPTSMRAGWEIATPGKNVHS